jgi:hypothetical protein
LRVAREVDAAVATTAERVDAHHRHVVVHHVSVDDGHVSIEDGCVLVGWRCHVSVEDGCVLVGWGCHVSVEGDHVVVHHVVVHHVDGHVVVDEVGAIGRRVGASALEFGTAAAHAQGEDGGKHGQGKGSHGVLSGLVVEKVGTAHCGRGRGGSCDRIRRA